MIYVDIDIAKLNHYAAFQAYYNKKKAEDRTHYNALGRCAGKLVRVIWKMMTDDIDFNLD